MLQPLPSLQVPHGQMEYLLGRQCQVRTHAVTPRDKLHAGGLGSRFDSRSGYRRSATTAARWTAARILPARAAQGAWDATAGSSASSGATTAGRAASWCRATLVWRSPTARYRLVLIESSPKAVGKLYCGKQGTHYGGLATSRDASWTGNASATARSLVCTDTGGTHCCRNAIMGLSFIYKLGLSRGLLVL